MQHTRQHYNITLNRVSEIGRTIETAKYNTRSIKESTNPNRQDILTAVIVSIASPNKNTKLEQLSQSYAITAQDTKQSI